VILGSSECLKKSQASDMPAEREVHEQVQIIVNERSPCCGASMPTIAWYSEEASMNETKASKDKPV
jgi:hypothetical protein